MSLTVCLRASPVLQRLRWLTSGIFEEFHVFVYFLESWCPQSAVVYFRLELSLSVIQLPYLIFFFFKFKFRHALNEGFETPCFTVLHNRIPQRQPGLNQVQPADAVRTMENRGTVHMYHFPTSLTPMISRQEKKKKIPRNVWNSLMNDAFTSAFADLTGPSCRVSLPDSPVG